MSSLSRAVPHTQNLKLHQGPCGLISRRIRLLLRGRVSTALPLIGTPAERTVLREQAGGNAPLW